MIIKTKIYNKKGFIISSLSSIYERSWGSGLIKRKFDGLRICILKGVDISE